MSGYIGNAPTAVPLTSADIADGIITSAKITNGTIAIADFSATGTPSASTFLRGDNAWGSAGASAGQVIQVLSATDGTQRNTTSTSYVTASNTLSVTITPASASNKIFLLCTSVSYGLSSGGRVLITIFRGATNIGGSATSAFAENRPDWNPLAFSYLDSPSTTSAITYQVYFKTDTSGTAYLNNDTLASLTAFEIKG